MLFGIHSLLFNETFIEKDLPLLDKCKRLGFDAVEIIPFDPDNFPAAKVRSVAADLGLVINTGYGMPAEYNTISPDAQVRRNGIDFSKRLVDLSVEAGARVFGGMIYCGWGYLTGRMRTEEEWKWAVEGYREIAAHALQADPNLVLGIEPVNRFESHLINIAADAGRFIADVGLPNVKVHLDTFHMIREEDDIAGAVRATGAALGYVHACEKPARHPRPGPGALGCVLRSAPRRRLRRLRHHRIVRPRHGEDRQALLHLAEAGRFARTTGRRGPHATCALCTSRCSLPSHLPLIKSS